MLVVGEKGYWIDHPPCITGKKEWEELDPNGRVPHVRCSQAAAAVGTKIVYLGGSHYK